jgi:hypothetical protein
VRNMLVEVSYRKQNQTQGNRINKSGRSVREVGLQEAFDIKPYLREMWLLERSANHIRAQVGVLDVRHAGDPPVLRHCDEIIWCSLRGCALRIGQGESFLR